MPTKRLAVAHHKWLRRILGITRKQKAINEEVRRTGMGNLNETPRRNLKDSLVTYTDWMIVDWASRYYNGFKRRRDRPRKKWRSAIDGNIKKSEMSWEDAGNKILCRSCNTQCAAGRWMD